ncbi:MAG: acyl-CoA dehydrogenase [Proteobacteria bacterium]|nr:MAG: acyl-CoA dehydrogenase [Pseudomonadota bacterium]
MSIYAAPIKEFQFVLEELADLNAIAQFPGFEEATPEMVGAILEEAGKLATNVLDPINYSGDQQGAKLVDGKVQAADGFAEAYQQFIENGWTSVNFPEEVGGQGLPFLVQSAATEMWNAANASFALCPLLTAGAVEALLAHGSPELNKTYLEQMVSGNWTGTMNLTEPQAGSDLAAVRAQAEPVGDHYLIKGQKIFITWGDHEMSENVLHLVLARLPGAPEGVKGISLFLVPKFLVNEDGSLGERNDAYAISLEHKMGIHASPTCVMSFGDNGGAVGYLVGEPNNGLACMFTMMNHARLEVGMQGVGVSDRAYQRAVSYARERKQGTAHGHDGRVAIIHHPDVRRMLMHMRAMTEAARAVSFMCSSAHDISHHSEDADQRAYYARRLGLLTPVAKAWCTEVGMEVTSLGVQVHGGMGFMQETGAEQHMRDARIFPIYEGTNGIQANDLVGRKLLRDRGEAMGEFLAELQAFNESLEEHFDEGSGWRSGFNEALSAFEDATHYLLFSVNENPNAAPSASFNYMMCMGVLAGGWLMIRSAIAAQAKIDAGESDTFYKSKITTAQFYVEQILPRALAHKTAVMSGADSIMAMDADAF